MWVLFLPANDFNSKTTHSQIFSFQGKCAARSGLFFHHGEISDFSCAALILLVLTMFCCVSFLNSLTHVVLFIYLLALFCFQRCARCQVLKVEWVQSWSSPVGKQIVTACAIETFCRGNTKRVWVVGQRSFLQKLILDHSFKEKRGRERKEGNSRLKKKKPNRCASLGNCPLIRVTT